VTDHAPHALEDKEVGFDFAPSGMIGLETSVGLVMAELVDKRILSFSQMAEKMSAAPAKIMGLENKGAVKEGYDADITIIDPDKEWVLNKEDIVSKSRNTPFIGRKFKGAVSMTICGGKVVYKDK
jgi:dihydroorotase